MNNSLQSRLQPLRCVLPAVGVEDLTARGVLAQAGVRPRHTHKFTLDPDRPRLPVITAPRDLVLSDQRASTPLTCSLRTSVRPSPPRSSTGIVLLQVLYHFNPRALRYVLCNFHPWDLHICLSSDHYSFLFENFLSTRLLLVISTQVNRSFFPNRCTDDVTHPLLLHCDRRRARGLQRGNLNSIRDHTRSDLSRCA